MAFGRFRKRFRRLRKRARRMSSRFLRAPHKFADTLPLGGGKLPFRPPSPRALLPPQNRTDPLASAPFVRPSGFVIGPEATYAPGTIDYLLQLRRAGMLPGRVRGLTRAFREGRIS
jgi:hypothetical protein